MQSFIEDVGGAESGGSDVCVAGKSGDIESIIVLSQRWQCERSIGLNLGCILAAAELLETAAGAWTKHHANSSGIRIVRSWCSSASVNREPSGQRVSRRHDERDVLHVRAADIQRHASREHAVAVVDESDQIIRTGNSASEIGRASCRERV